jgi:hypothetical protein
VFSSRTDIDSISLTKVSTVRAMVSSPVFLRP